MRFGLKSTGVWFLFILLVAPFVASATHGESSSEVPLPKAANPEGYPTPRNWAKDISFNNTLKLEFGLDLDYLAPLGKGTTNAAVWLSQFSKGVGAREGELKEILKDRISFKYGKKEWKILPGDHPHLGEAEPWTEQAECRFFKKIWSPQSHEHNMPNLFHALMIGKSYVARGLNETDPAKAAEDFRRVIRLGRLLRQDDITVIHDLMAVYLIRLGAEAHYVSARQHGDTETMLLCALIINDANSIRFISSKRNEILGTVSQQISSKMGSFRVFASKMDFEDDVIKEIISGTHVAYERRFRLEFMDTLWDVMHTGEASQKKLAKEALELLTEDSDAVVVARAKWLLKAKWPRKN